MPGLCLALRFGTEVIMKTVLIVLLLLVPGFAKADQYAHGYVRQNGTYVQPYMRTSPDSNPYNNYSTTGNTNPYTGSIGHHNPTPQVQYGNTQPSFNGYGQQNHD